MRKVEKKNDFSLYWRLSVCLVSILEHFEAVIIDYRHVKLILSCLVFQKYN
jgi:hypothetical protein